jgi:hypothetical protein
MDEEEKLFKEYNAQKAQESMADIEYRMERANNPRVQREEEERLKGILRRKGIPVPGEQEVKKKKKKKTLVSKYNYKKGKAYAQSPRQVKTT